MRTFKMSFVVRSFPKSNKTNAEVRLKGLDAPSSGQLE